MINYYAYECCFILFYVYYFQQDCVQATQRDESIQHLLKVSVHFGFEPETFCLAVKYVDTFLGKIKVRFSFVYSALSVVSTPLIRHTYLMGQGSRILQTLTD